MQTNPNHNGTDHAEASGPKKMLTRINMLQSRRWKIVLEQLLEALKSSKAKDVTVDLVDLILIFGTTFRRAPEKYYGPKRGWLWPWLDNCRKTGYPCKKETAAKVHSFARPSETLVAEKDRDEALWEALKPVLADQLRGFDKVSDIVGRNVVQDILRVAKLINFPAQARKDLVDISVLRVPRTWGKGIDPHTLLPVLKKAA